MVYTSKRKKFSGFTAGDTLAIDDYLVGLKSGGNNKVQVSKLLELFDDRYGASLRTYKFKSDLINDDIQLDEWAIVEETSFSLYTITNNVASGADLTLASGLTATRHSILNPDATDYADLRAKMAAGVYKINDRASLTNPGIAGPGTIRQDTVGGAVTDNGGTIITASGGATSLNEYHWERDYSGGMNVRWFGAKSDGVTDDTSAITNAISAAGNLQNIYVPNGSYLVSSTVVSNRNIFCDQLAEFIPNASGTYNTNISGKKLVFDLTREGGIINGARFDFSGKTGFCAVELSLQSVAMEWCTVNCDSYTDGNYGCSSVSNAQNVQFNIFNRCDIGYRIEFEGFSNKVFSNRFELCGDCVAIDTSGVTATNYPITHNTFNFPKRTGVLVDCSSADFRNLILMNNYYESTDDNTIFLSFTNPSYIQGTVAHNLVLGNAANSGQKGVYPASLPAAVELLIMGNSFARLDTALNVNNSTLIANEYFAVTTRNASSANTGTIEERLKIEDKSGSDNIVIRPNNIVGSVAGTLTFSNTGNITLTSSAGDIILSGLPTSSAGLPSGALWNNSGVINIA